MESTANKLDVKSCYQWTGEGVKVISCSKCDDTSCHFNERHQEPTKAEYLFDRADRIVEKLAPYLFFAAMGYFGAHAVLWILR